MMVPNQIDRYRIIDLLGQGGMGKVYHAYDPDLDREVVIKFIAPPDPKYLNEWYERFRREAQAIGRLNHPHIVTVYDVGLDHNPPYIVMELLTGGTLSDYLGHGLLPWSEALSLIRPLAAALAYAHRASVIHRDVKPSNVMFTDDAPLPAVQRGPLGLEFPVPQRGPWKIIKLVDFGLARPSDSKNLTLTGVVVGTPAYMAPEQAIGDPVDNRVDIFALGLILFEMIAGYNPIEKPGVSVYSLLSSAAAGVAIDESVLADLAPPEVIRLIEQAAAHKREDRYPTCEAFMADLDRCLGAGDKALSHDPSPDLISQVPSPQSAANIVIQKSSDLDLSPDIEQVLRGMFSQFSRLVIEAEYGHGLSGGRVFRVRPVEADGKVHLPAVVKIAPLSLIQQEWQAYQKWVANKLPGAARLESAPTLPAGRLWDGLRYELVGEGAYEVQSLYRYYQQASADDLWWVLTERLFKMIGVHWWLERKLDRTFQMQADYDAILPVNLQLQIVDLPPEAQRYRISSGQLPPSSLGKGGYVQLERFVVTEVEPERQQLTLDLLPPSAGLSSTAYRLRLVHVADLDRYQVGQIIDSLAGQIVVTRQDSLQLEARQVLGAAVDLADRRLVLPSDRSDWSSEFFTSPPPLFLPNPLQIYPELLQTFMPVNIATIHGDLNLENILIDPDTRHFNLIDFATVRQGHALHDLLRLETEVVTKLISAVVTEIDLPALAIYTIYQQLHRFSGESELSAIFENLPQTLKNAVTMLAAIRKMVRVLLFNPDDWNEYYRGLVIYLLGALKFKNLDRLPQAPLPKQIAFWAAATLVDLIDQPPSVLPELGQLLNDRYQVARLIGFGGMGTVYQGRDLTLERDVAIKVMHPQFAQRLDLRERFLQEAQATAQLNHPGIAQIFDFGQANTFLYIVMEFIPGADLHQRLRDLRTSQRWIRPSEALEMVRQVCMAVDYIHRQDILHCDLKPGNIMLKAEPGDSLPYQPVLMDMGLARLLYQELKLSSSASFGTPAYMSPEQALGEPLDRRSDVYAIGILLYELVTGQLPFPVKTLSDALYYHTQEAPPPPRLLQPELPEPVEQIILKALAKDAADRFPDMAAIAQALAEALPQASTITSAPTELVEVVSLLALPSPQETPQPPPEIEISIPNLPTENPGLPTAGGDVISVGDISGSYVAIGSGAQVTVTQGSGDDDLDRLFKAIYRQIEARLADPDVDKEELSQFVRNIQQEVAKGEQANPIKVKRWLNNLALVAPDISKTTAAGLTQQRSGIAAAVRQIAAEAAGDTE